MYRINEKLIFKRLTEEERNLRINELRKKCVEIQKELDKSPCYYRGCELWLDCRTCNGFKKDCSARLPECIFKDKNGNWIDEDP